MCTCRGWEVPARDLTRFPSGQVGVGRPWRRTCPPGGGGGDTRPTVLLAPEAPRAQNSTVTPSQPCESRPRTPPQQGLGLRLFENCSGAPDLSLEVAIPPGAASEWGLRVRRGSPMRRRRGPQETWTARKRGSAQGRPWWGWPAAARAPRHQPQPPRMPGGTRDQASVDQRWPLGSSPLPPPSLQRAPELGTEAAQEALRTIRERRKQFVRVDRTNYSQSFPAFS